MDASDVVWQGAAAPSALRRSRSRRAPATARICWSVSLPPCAAANSLPLDPDQLTDHANGLVIALPRFEVQPARRGDGGKRCCAVRRARVGRTIERRGARPQHPGQTRAAVTTDRHTWCCGRRVIGPNGSEPTAGPSAARASLRARPRSEEAAARPLPRCRRSRWDQPPLPLPMRDNSGSRSSFTPPSRTR